MLVVEADVSDECDSSTDWVALAARGVGSAVVASAHCALIESGLALEVSVRFTDDEEVRTLNAGYRGKDKATNVLSFPMIDPELLDSLAGAVEGEALLGDIVLAHGVCMRE